MELKVGYKMTEVGAIPKEWEVKNLGDLGNVVRGGSPRPAGDARYFNGSFIPWLTVATLTNIPDHQLLVSETATCLTEEGAKRSRTLDAGTLVIANSGATLGVAKVLGVKSCANDGIAAIDEQQFGEKIFCCYYVNTLTENLRKTIATGNGQPNLNTKLIREISIPFPPLAEQRAIAAALNNMDALLNQLDCLVAKKRDIKHAAMQQLLTSQIRLPGFSGGWNVRQLGDIVSIDPENLGSDTRGDFKFNYISLEDVDEGTLRSYSKEVFSTSPSRARRKICKDDLLISTVRPNLKSHLLFRKDVGAWVCSTGFCVLRCPQGEVHPGYVFFHFFSEGVIRQIDVLLTGSNYPAINSGDVRALRIPFPAYAEQLAIATVLSDMDAEIAAIETRCTKTRALKQAMMQELLTGRTRLADHHSLEAHGEMRQEGFVPREEALP